MAAQKGLDQETADRALYRSAGTQALIRMTDMLELHRMTGMVASYPRTDRFLSHPTTVPKGSLRKRADSTNSALGSPIDSPPASNSPPASETHSSGAGLEPSHIDPLPARAESREESSESTWRRHASSSERNGDRPEEGDPASLESGTATAPPTDRHWTTDEWRWEKRHTGRTSRTSYAELTEVWKPREQRRTVFRSGSKASRSLGSGERESAPAGDTPKPQSSCRERRYDWRAVTRAGKGPQKGHGTLPRCLRRPIRGECQRASGT